MRDLIVDGPVITDASNPLDHFSNKRTYLAWMRTSLAIISASIGLLKWKSVTAGFIVAVLGLTALLSSTNQYFVNMRHLEHGQFALNVRGILAVFVVTVGAVIAAFILHMNNGL